MTSCSNNKINNSKSYVMANSSIRYYNVNQNYILKYKTKDKIQLIVILWGEVEYSFSHEYITQKNTELIVIPFYSNVDIHVIKQSKLMIIETSDELVKSVYSNVKDINSLNNSIENPMTYIQIKYNNLLYKCIQSIHNEYVENYENPFLVELNINKLIYHLLKTEYAGYLFSIKANHPLEHVKYYIYRNIRRNIKISELAEMVGMNSSNFTNTFKRNFGMAPISYINTKKMNVAEQMLKENSVTEVAYELGFENISTFITQFKKVYNVTPKQYQISKMY